MQQSSESGPTGEELAQSSNKLAPHNSVFKLKSYWEERFQEEEVYDWLVTYTQVKQLVLPQLRPSDRILVVGCGNSSFSADLYDDGYVNITNIDFSSVVINKMQAENSEKRPTMAWLCMDMLDLSFEDNTFDAVIDKAGMDALMVDEGDVWDPEQKVVGSVDRMLLGIAKVLRPGGKFLQISFAQPHFRTKYLSGYWWTKAHGDSSIAKSDSDCTRVDSSQSMTAYQTYKGYCSRYNWNLSCTPIETDVGSLNSYLYIVDTVSN